MNSIIVLILISVATAIASYYQPFDSTDNKELRKRSGLRLYTDMGTGLQYIKGGFFGDMIPRLDATGKHMQTHMYKNKDQKIK